MKLSGSTKQANSTCDSTEEEGLTQYCPRPFTLRPAFRYRPTRKIEDWEHIASQGVEILRCSVLFLVSGQWWWHVCIYIYVCIYYIYNIYVLYCILYIVYYILYIIYYILYIIYNIIIYIYIILYILYYIYYLYIILYILYYIILYYIILYYILYFIFYILYFIFYIIYTHLQILIHIQMSYTCFSHFSACLLFRRLGCLTSCCMAALGHLYFQRKLCRSLQGKDPVECLAPYVPWSKVCLVNPYWRMVNDGHTVIPPVTRIYMITHYKPLLMMLGPP